MENDVLIINQNNLIGKHKAEHENYEYTKYEVTPRSEFNQCHLSVYEIPPLKANYPYHYHVTNTEAFYIISGCGMIETQSGNRQIKEGDFIVCPPMEKGAHKIVNTSEDTILKYIDFDTTNSPDIVHYPDSGKTGIIVHNQPSAFFYDTSKVDYYDGESKKTDRRNHP